MIVVLAAVAPARALEWGSMLVTVAETWNLAWQPAESTCKQQDAANHPSLFMHRSPGSWLASNYPTNPCLLACPYRLVCFIMPVSCFYQYCPPHHLLPHRTHSYQIAARSTASPNENESGLLLNTDKDYTISILAEHSWRSAKSSQTQLDKSSSVLWSDCANSSQTVAITKRSDRRTKMSVS